jgi:hypothetical protein
VDEDGNILTYGYWFHSILYSFLLFF